MKVLELLQEYYNKSLNSEIVLTPAFSKSHKERNWNSNKHIPFNILKHKCLEFTTGFYDERFLVIDIDSKTKNGFTEIDRQNIQKQLMRLSYLKVYVEKSLSGEGFHLILKMNKIDDFLKRLHITKHNTDYSNLNDVIEFKKNCIVFPSIEFKKDAKTTQELLKKILEGDYYQPKVIFGSYFELEDVSEHMDLIIDVLLKIKSITDNKLNKNKQTKENNSLVKELIKQQNKTIKSIQQPNIIKDYNIKTKNIKISKEQIIINKYVETLETEEKLSLLTKILDFVDKPHILEKDKVKLFSFLMDDGSKPGAYIFCNKPVWIYYDFVAKQSAWFVSILEHIYGKNILKEIINEFIPEQFKNINHNIKTAIHNYFHNQIKYNKMEVFKIITNILDFYETNYKMNENLIITPNGTILISEKCILVNTNEGKISLLDYFEKYFNKNGTLYEDLFNLNVFPKAIFINYKNISIPKIETIKIHQEDNPMKNAKNICNFIMKHKNKKKLIIAPTGAGKTTAVKMLCNQTDKNIILVVPLHLQVEQEHNKPDERFDIFTNYCYGKYYTINENYKLTIMTQKKFITNYEKYKDYYENALIIIDEAHTLFSDAFRLDDLIQIDNIINKLPKENIIYMTATPTNCYFDIDIKLQIIPKNKENKVFTFYTIKNDKNKSFEQNVKETILNDIINHKKNTKNEYKYMVYIDNKTLNTNITEDFIKNGITIKQIDNDNPYNFSDIVNMAKLNDNTITTRKIGCGLHLFNDEKFRIYILNNDINQSLQIINRFRKNNLTEAIFLTKYKNTNPNDNETCETKLTKLNEKLHKKLLYIKAINNRLSNKELEVIFYNNNIHKYNTIDVMTELIEQQGWVWVNFDVNDNDKNIKISQYIRNNELKDFLDNVLSLPTTQQQAICEKINDERKRKCLEILLSNYDDLKEELFRLINEDKSVLNVYYKMKIKQTIDPEFAKEYISRYLDKSGKISYKTLETLDLFMFKDVPIKNAINFICCDMLKMEKVIVKGKVYFKLKNALENTLKQEIENIYNKKKYITTYDINKIMKKNMKKSEITKILKEMGFKIVVNKVKGKKKRVWIK